MKERASVLLSGCHGDKHLLFLIESKREADPFAALRASSSFRSLENHLESQPTCHSEEVARRPTKNLLLTMKNRSRFLSRMRDRK